MICLKTKKEFAISELRACSLRTYVLNDYCHDEQYGKETERYDETNARIHCIISFRLDIFFEFVHKYPSYFYLSIDDSPKKIYTCTLHFPLLTRVVTYMFTLLGDTNNYKGDTAG
jgi:hypothetical protein